MSEMSREEKIFYSLGYMELLGQLQEECSELIQACSKVRRAHGGVNPVACTAIGAHMNLLEELADVAVCIRVLKKACLVGSDIAEIEKITEEKLDRWVERLEYLNGKGEVKDDTEGDPQQGY